MKFSLRSKFYLLILPAVAVLIAVMVILMIPFGRVQKNFEQINEGLGEVVAAESFARNYAKQLKQCASFIASGSAENEKLYESAKLAAGAGAAGWLAAENAHKGDPPAEHADELRMLHGTQSSWKKVSDACDGAITLAKAGQTDQAMADVEAALDGEAGQTVEQNVDEQLPEEEAQLNRYLDNLWGAVNSNPLMGVSGVLANVESMRDHAANAVFSAQFARYYNTQVYEALASAVTGSAPGQEQAEAADQAGEALDGWASHAAQQEGHTTLPLVTGIQNQYKDISAAVDKAAAMVQSNDQTGALTLLETKAGASVQASLSKAVDKEVASQKAALNYDTGEITSATDWTTWGVGIVGGLLLLVSLAGAFMVSRTVVGPVVELRDAAKKFGEGGDFEVKTKSRDELGELATAFNEMAAERLAAEDELRASRDDLDVRVQERTRQLSDANQELLDQIEERGKTEAQLRTSEEKYRFLADNMEDMAFMINMELKTLYVSPSVKKLGYSEEEWMALTADKQLYADSFSEMTSLLVEELQHDAEREPDRNRTVEVYFNHKNGYPVCFECVVNFVRNAEGAPVGVYGLARDITQRKNAEQRLRLTQFEVDSAMDLILRIASDGTIAYANAASGTLLGYEANELPGVSLSRIMPNFPEEHWDEIWKALEESRTFRFEATGVRRDGTVFPLDATFNFFTFEGRDFMVIFGKDVTERKIAEERQELLNQEIMSANKELNDFAYVVSHDLKAPLRGIGSLASWLSTDYSEVLDENGRRQLELLLDRAKRMEGLIESILQYSRVGRLREEKVKVDLNELVASTVELLAVPSSITVTVDELPTVVGERTRLAQVFQNLIGNAAKFMDRHEGGRIEVSSSDEGEFWKFAVADNGPGIDPKYHEQIFRIFQTLSGRDDTDSTGIGLTLVNKIVEMQGGRVWVESKAGEGVTFFFTLPKAQV